MLDLKNKESRKINIPKLLMITMVALLGLVTISTYGVETNTVEARTVLPAVKGGTRYRAHNSAGTPLRYKYLLGSKSSYGFLPDIENLQQYGYSNKGWGINTPGKNELKGDTDTGGRTMTHSVYPSKTGFISYRGEDYLRIVGSAIMPQYFHHTADNHQVAILTRENGKNSTIKLWKATLVNHTSSASHDYGYGDVDGLSDWKARITQPGHGTLPLHVTNDPYPLVAESAYGKGDSRYFDRGNINLLNNSYHQGINRNQVSKLIGLGQVGANFRTEGNYILDYTGFGVDIPLRGMISDGSKNSDIEFQVIMTMKTPNGHKARVVGQSLGIPGVPSKSKETVDVEGGNVGTAELKQSNINNITYTPVEDLLRNFKRTSNFSTSEHSVDTLTGNPTSGNRVRYRQFTASSSEPRMVGFGFNHVPLFNDKARQEINSTAGKRSADFVEFSYSGRGEMWVGWDVPSISNHKVYTTVGGAYNRIPSATMSYRPTDTNVKPVIIRHRIVKK